MSVATGAPHPPHTHTPTHPTPHHTTHAQRARVTRRLCGSDWSGGGRQKYTEILQPHYGSVSIWEGWGLASGLLPCPVYCRHCVLASRREGVPPEAARSFVQETYLADRTTTLEEYLALNPEVMEAEPPPSLVGRYSG